MSARSLNKVMLIGNLTRDPEMRYTGTGTAVVSFSIATNKSWKNQQGETEESVQFHNLVAWQKMAEICQQLLTKGKKVYVEGELNTRSWEGEDGVTRYKTEITISEMILLDSKGEASTLRQDSAEPGSATASTPTEGKPAAKSADKDVVKTKEKKKEVMEDPTEDDLPF